MSASRITPWLISAAMLVLIAGTAGWALGSGAAKGKSDAESAREQGFAQGHKLIFDESHRETARRGFKAGALRGRKAGHKTGAREGAAIGAGNAVIEEAVESEKSASAAESAADSEIAARSANCGIVPSAPSWCPTGDELSAWQAAVKAAEEAAEKAEKEKQKEKQKAGNDRP